MENADSRHHHSAGNTGPEKRGRSAVFAGGKAGQKTIERKHKGRHHRDDGDRREDSDARLEDDENPDKAHTDRRPAPPANGLTQDGPRKRRNEKRIGCKDRVALDEAKFYEGQHHDADFSGKQDTTENLEEGLGRRCRGADRAFFAACQNHHEGGKEPVADHHHHEDVVVAGKIAADPVLHRKNKGRGDHQPDAEAGI